MKRRLIFAAAAVALMLSSCQTMRAVSGTSGTDDYVVNESGRHTLVVATHDSEWKHQTIAALSATLGSSVRIEVRDLNALRSIQHGECDALVVLAPILAWDLQTDVERFSRRADELGVPVVFCITSIGVEPPETGVDTVSAASAQSDDEPIVFRTPGEAARLISARLPF